jgi:hypothetical protein
MHSLSERYGARRSAHGNEKKRGADDADVRRHKLNLGQQVRNGWNGDQPRRRDAAE